ncbi:MAG: hypothetical protein RR386_06710, partial [Bacteroidaceae bacterium]
MHTDLYIEVAKMVLPSELVEYFEITKVESGSETMDITLEEIVNGVEGYEDDDLRPNGFYEETLV